MPQPLVARLLLLPLVQVVQVLSLARLLASRQLMPRWSMLIRMAAPLPRAKYIGT